MSPLALVLALLLGDDPLTPKSVDVDGHAVRVRVAAVVKKAPKLRPAAKDPRADLVAALPLEGATPYPLPLRDETIVRTWHNAAPSARKAELFRVAKDGTVRRAVLPVNERDWIPAVCGKRWLVMAFAKAGTVIWDLDENALVQVHSQFGRYGNAWSSGPACSPDGKYAALPTPYGGRVTIVRLDGGAVVANIPIDAPGGVQWTSGGLTLRPTVLPYE